MREWIGVSQPDVCDSAGTTRSTTTNRLNYVFGAFPWDAAKVTFPAALGAEAKGLRAAPSRPHRGGLGIAAAHPGGARMDPLAEFASNVRLASSAEQERFLLKDEMATIRTAIRDCDPEYKPRLVAKMIFLDICGENVNFGQMEVLGLVGHSRFSHKRIGYLGAMTLFDETSELSVLLTHTVLKDLQSKDPHLECLGLMLVANVGSLEMCQTTSQEIARLMVSDTSLVVKKAAMAAIRCIQKSSDFCALFKPLVPKLLKHGSHGVVIATLNLIEHILELEPASRAEFQRYQSSLTKILRDLSGGRMINPEFDFSKMHDPLLQVRILRVLQVFKRPTKELDAVLESVVTGGGDLAKSPARSVLVGAVAAVFAASESVSLRCLAVNQVGRLLQRDASAAYLGLSALVKVLFAGNTLVDRPPQLTAALMLHRSGVLESLNSKDAMIRRRALTVVCALIDAANCREVLPEILNFLKKSDSLSFTVDLVSKLFNAVQKFSPSPRWGFDTLLRMSVEHEAAVSAASEIVTAMVKAAASDPAHSVAALKEAIVWNPGNELVVQLGAFIFGELASEGFDDLFHVLADALSAPGLSPRSKATVISAVGKLAVHFGRKADAVAVIRRFTRARALTLQCRACEVLWVLESELADVVLAPIGQTTQEVRVAATASSDLLVSEDLLGVVEPVAAAEARPKPSSSYGAELLSQLVDAPAGTAPTAVPIKPGATEAFRSSELVGVVEAKRNPANPRQIAARVSLFSLARRPLSDLSVKFAAAAGWRCGAKPPTGTVLEPAGGAPVVTELMLQAEIDVPLTVRVRVVYRYGSQPCTEDFEIPAACFA